MFNKVCFLANYQKISDPRDRKGGQGAEQRRLFNSSRFNFSQLTFHILFMQKRPNMLCKIQLGNGICNAFMYLCYHCSREKFFFPCFAWKGSGITRTKRYRILQRRTLLLHKDLVFLRFVHRIRLVRGRLSQLWNKKIKINWKANIWLISDVVLLTSLNLTEKTKRIEFTLPKIYTYRCHLGQDNKTVQNT